MDKLQQEKLEILNDDQILLDAIYSVFFEASEKEKPEINDTDNNDIVGQKYRAHEQSKIIIKRAFKDIANYKRSPKNEKTFNRAK